MVDHFYTKAIMIDNGAGVVLYEHRGNYIFVAFVYARTGRYLYKLHKELKSRYNTPIRFRTQFHDKVKNHAKHLYDDYYEES